MPPRWDRCKSKLDWAIQTGLGAESCTIIIPPDSSYDFGEGEQDSGSTDGTTSSIKVALITTNKNDFDYIPEGFRTKVTYKIYSVSKLDRTMIIQNDDDRYEIITPSIKRPAGGLNHAYMTFVARIENQVEE